GEDADQDVPPRARRVEHGVEIERAVEIRRRVSREMPEVMLAGAPVELAGSRVAQSVTPAELLRDPEMLLVEGEVREMHDGRVRAVLAKIAQRIGLVRESSP